MSQCSLIQWETADESSKNAPPIKASNEKSCSFQIAYTISQQSLRNTLLLWMVLGFALVFGLVETFLPNWLGLFWLSFLFALFAAFLLAVVGRIAPRKLAAIGSRLEKVLHWIAKPKRPLTFWLPISLAVILALVLAVFRLFDPVRFKAIVSAAEKVIDWFLKIKDILG